MTVYIDPVTFKCSTTKNAAGTYIPYETDFFDGKCVGFIEGHRIVPENCDYIRGDGAVFSGAEMIVPWKDSRELRAAQAQYEADLAAAAAAYQEGVNSAYDQ